MNFRFPANEAKTQEQINAAEKQLSKAKITAIREAHDGDWAENYLEALKRNIAFASEEW